MAFTFTPLAIPEVILITPQLFRDERGFFAETFQHADFVKQGIDYHFVQDNYSVSKAGVLRGLHFQNPPMAQGKLVRVTSGKIFDVAVDIRKKSPTYGKWVSTILSAENNNIFWVPPGFAHGVLILEDDTHLLYKVTEVYSPAHDQTVCWHDPEIGIKWPEGMDQPLISAKDAAAPQLCAVNNSFIWEGDKNV